MYSILIGNLVDVDFEFKARGTLTTPAAATVEIKAPGGATETRAFPGDLDELDSGLLRLTHKPAAVGMWRYSISSTGPAEGAAYTFVKVIEIPR
jgi:hypothetical protein